MAIGLNIYLILGIILAIITTKGVDFESRWHKYDEFGLLSHIKNKKFFVFVIIMLFGIPYIIKMVYDAFREIYNAFREKK
jgi:hypothetical protein